MTPEQLAIFWDHFKKLDDDRVRFDKPPTNWKPPDVRDMTEAELGAYWSAFRQIVGNSIVVQDDQPKHAMNETDMVVAEGFDSHDGQVKRRRIRGKQPDKHQEYVIPFAQRRKNLGLHSKPLVVKDDLATKRKYTQTCKVARPGKQPSVSIWTKVKLFEESRIQTELHEEFERLKQDPEIKHPEKHMLRTSRPAGLYQGCFSKSHWGNKRIKHKWDLFCKVAPKQAKRYAELPNHVRLVLGVDEMKHSNSKFKVVDGARQVPQPLVEALENLLMERIHLGEEVDNDFCTQVLLQLIEVWNSQVQELVSDVKTHVGPNLLKTHDSELGDEPTESQMEHAQREAERAMSDRWWYGQQWYGWRNSWSNSEWWKSSDSWSNEQLPSPKKSVTFQIEPVRRHFLVEDIDAKELRKSVPFATDVEYPPKKAIWVSIFRKTVLACFQKTKEPFLTRAQLTSIQDSSQSEFLETMLERERRVFSVPWCTKKRRVITWDYHAQTCQEVEEVWNEPIQNYY